jgi:Arc/MetJ-type ribon-helix-helix transcriptional regulator
VPEPTTVGLSKEGHEKLQRLKEDGYFGEMADAYRFAVALALANGIETGPSANVQRATIFNVGTLDPDRALSCAVQALMQISDEPVYKVVERLADWGVDEMWSQREAGTLSISSLLGEVEHVGAM